MSTNNIINNSANSICIPRAFANISEARVRKVFEALNIFAIEKIDMIQRKNEKGDSYQRIFVHIKSWSSTADADKARERLLSGKELKIVYDEPWFWKVSLSNWKPKPAPVPITSVYDRKPRIRLEFEDEEEELPYDIRWGDELARRKRQETKNNIESATQLLSNLSLEDQRPYGERRLDPILCEQDVQSGFRDRRLSHVKDDRRQQDDKELLAAYEPKEALTIAIALPEVEKKKEPLVMDKELLTKMYHRFGGREITEEIYLNNRQDVRDQMRFEQNDVPEYYNGVDELYWEPPSYKNEDGIVPVAPKKKGRKIVE
jgi:hypothetical protein